MNALYRTFEEAGLSVATRRQAHGVLHKAGGRRPRRGQRPPVLLYAVKALQAFSTFPSRLCCGSRIASPVSRSIFRTPAKLNGS